MTSKLIGQAGKIGASGQFPEFPPRDDMQNPIYLHLPGHLTTLHRHFGSLETTLVLSEVPVGRQVGQREGILIPDLIIAFDVDAALVIAQRGFSIDVQGKGPDFVLEVASSTTSRNDEEGKRAGYLAYGVQEYWRFDPSGGEYYQQGLAGDRLADGAYQLVPIEGDGALSWGYSEILGLALCWEGGQLRWWDPAAGLYLSTHDELAEGLAAEQEARREADQARQIAESRVRELEAELARRPPAEESP